MTYVPTLSAKEIELLNFAENDLLQTIGPDALAQVPAATDEFLADVPGISPVHLAQVFLQIITRNAAEMTDIEAGQNILGFLIKDHLIARSNLLVAMACHLTRHVRGRLN